MTISLDVLLSIQENGGYTEFEIVTCHSQIVAGGSTNRYERIGQAHSEIKNFQKDFAKLQREFRELHAEFQGSVGRFHTLCDKRVDFAEDYLRLADACSGRGVAAAQTAPRPSERKASPCMDRSDPSTDCVVKKRPEVGLYLPQASTAGSVKWKLAPPSGLFSAQSLPW